MKKRKFYGRLLVGLILIYSVFTLINQQKVINQYSKNSKDLSLQIEQAKEENNKLVAEKDNVNSKEFIEERARDMLEMYYPNEKVYVDTSM